MAKIKVSRTFNEDLEDLEAAAEANIDHCKQYVEEKAIKLITGHLEEFKKFIKAKEYNDGFQERIKSDEFCQIAQTDGKERECLCECYKLDKLAIYGIYNALAMLEDDHFKFQRGGDMFAWYYNNIFDRGPAEVQAIPNVPNDIAEELLAFDRDILKDISEKDAKIGLSEFISLMAQPALIWRQNYEFPRLYSLDEKAQLQIFNLFNYQQNESFRGNMKLTEPNFEEFSLPTLCKDSERRKTISDYCDVEENMPDLGLTMHLMHLSEYPLDFNENIKGLFK